MADPYAETAAAIEAILSDEFAAEQPTIIHDRIHESLGLKGIEIGIEPMNWARQITNANVKETFLLVRFYDMWYKDVDPYQQVDPRRITGFADRFEHAVQRRVASIPGTDNVWWFEVTRIEFPDDPTGNKSRFHATIRAYGENHAFVD